jgi:hypothetical protein
MGAGILTVFDSEQVWPLVTRNRALKRHDERLHPETWNHWLQPVTGGKQTYRHLNLSVRAFAGTSVATRFKEIPESITFLGRHNSKTNGKFYPIGKLQIYVLTMELTATHMNTVYEYIYAYAYTIAGLFGFRGLVVDYISQPVVTRPNSIAKPTAVRPSDCLCHLDSEWNTTLVYMTYGPGFAFGLAQWES